MCVVEVEGYRNLVTSCSHPVHDGMKISTNSQRAIDARRTIIELLLSNHPDDCLYCVRNNTCQLQDLSAQYCVRERHFHAPKREYKLDISSDALIRDQAKCILCGRCVRVCEEVMAVSAIDFVNRGSSTVVGTAFNESMNVSSCVNCGQCITACPTGALSEKSHERRVMDALRDPEKFVIVQHAPAISVTLAEEFGLPAGEDIDGKIVTALRRLGFDRVFDTSFAADLTIMEEASELVDRIKSGGRLPMFTSCSPAWIKYIEQFYPDYTANLSTCKSPQQMLGALIKNYYAEEHDLNPADIYSVSIMPCTAKKFESARPEQSLNGLSDIDASLTTRELVRIIKMAGIDLAKIPAGESDQPFGERSTAGKLFGGSGGVMEAAVRTAHFMLTGKELELEALTPVRNGSGFSEAQLEIGDLKLGIAVVSGLKNARDLMEQIRNGRDDLHFIEVMSCPGGCIGGGGQPIGTAPEKIRARQERLYEIDRQEQVRTSHGNEHVRSLYKEFLGQPLSELSHKLLHTDYIERNVLK